MPIYSFKCPKCHKVYDLRLHMSERNDPQLCPNCKVKMDKQLSCVRAFEINGIEATASMGKWHDKSTFRG